MTSHILHHINELKIEWRRNDFNFTRQQQEEYNLLIAARRERVLGFYKDGRVSKGRVKDSSI